jgi:putative transposase
MKSQTLKAKLEELQITGSHSRPRVSNDNPYVESLFRTLKYVPAWPSSGFVDLDEARQWVESFSRWYNEEPCMNQPKGPTRNGGQNTVADGSVSKW